MISPILVTGGTGTLGSLVVARLRQGGRRVRVLSRTAHEPAEGIEYAIGDLDTGAGIEAAVAGVETIVHCAGAQKGDAVKARHLVEAASRAGVRHLVNISVVGADRVPVANGMDRAHLQHPLHRAGRRPADCLPAPDCGGDRGHTAVCGEAGDQTDQESRSAGRGGHLA